MKLSKYFDLDEFCRSQRAARLGKRIEPTKTIIDSLTALSLTVLDPLRAEVGRPVVITSGYRPQWLNDAIGGARASQHQRGEAADITIKGMTPREIAATVRRLQLPVDQCIDEFGEWAHVSHKPYGPQRGEYLRAMVTTDVVGRTRTVYEPLW